MLMNMNERRMIFGTLVACLVWMTFVVAWQRSTRPFTELPPVESRQIPQPAPAFVVVQPYAMEIPPPTPNDPFFERWN